MVLGGVGLMWEHEGVMIVPDVIDGGFRCGDGGENGAC